MMQTRFGGERALAAVPADGSKLVKIGGALLVGALLMAPAAAMAAGATTGVQAGFSQIGTTLTTLISGAGGYLILIISVIVAAITLMASGRWTYVITALAVSLFLGYGLNIVASMGGVTATTDMLSSAIQLLPGAEGVEVALLPAEVPAAQ